MQNQQRLAGVWDIAQSFEKLGHITLAEGTFTFKKKQKTFRAMIFSHPDSHSFLDKTRAGKFLIGTVCKHTSNIPIRIYYCHL